MRIEDKTTGRELMQTTPSELKQRHLAFIARVRAAGRLILQYRVPCCGATVDGIAAGPGERWDTGATCPECGALYWKESTDEAITATPLPAPRAAF